MKVSANDSENRNLKILYTFCMWLCLVPHYNIKNLKYHRAYVLILYLLHYTIQTYNFFILCFQVGTLSLQVFFILIKALIIDLYIQYLIWHGVFLHPEYFKELFDLLQKLSTCENYDIKVHNSIRVKLFLFSVLFLTIFFYFVIISEGHVGIISICFLSLSSFYLVAHSFVLIINFELLLKKKFKNINISLEGLLQGHLLRRLDDRIDKRIKKLRENYITASKAVRTFNKIFGWPMLFVYVFMWVAVLDGVRFLIKNANGDTILIKDFYLEILMRTLYVLWSFGAVIGGLILAVICDTTTKEAQKTALTCYNLLLDVPTRSNNVNNHMLREELILLAEQATHQYPYFSAAGFFKINYNMLFGLLGTATSYFIVLIQINK